MASLSNLLTIALPVLLLVLRLPHAAATGTLIAFFSAAKYGGSTNWIVPDLASGTPLGCSAITQAPASAKFFWSASTGKWKCDYLIFYFSSSCTPSIDGTEPIIKSSVSSVPSFSLSRIPSTKALRCAVKANPCASVCSNDGNAQCLTTSTTITESSTTNYTVYLSEDCSTCKPGFSKPSQAGLCTAPDPCASAKCPADSTCDKSTGVAVCQCTKDNYVYNSTLNICQDNTPQVWLPILNRIRSQRGSPALTWSATLATSAQGGAASQACPPGSSVKFTKVDAGSPKAFSENDAYLSSSSESLAVNSWMNSTFLAPPARIISVNSTNVGCGKFFCRTSAGYYFVCLFSPFTY